VIQLPTGETRSEEIGAFQQMSYRNPVKQRTYIPTAGCVTCSVHSSGSAQLSQLYLSKRLRVERPRAFQMEKGELVSLGCQQMALYHLFIRTVLPPNRG